MKKIILYSAVALISSIGTANASQFHFDGNITYHNDVVMINFSLANDATDVRLWTDSNQNEVNFDPVIALWDQASGELIDQNDDQADVGDGQTPYDSGLSLQNLSAGNYLLTIAMWDNFPWSNDNIADGFRYDGIEPIPVASWDEVYNGGDVGPYWSVNIDGVDTASPVPVPAAIWLFGSAIAGFVGVSRRKKTTV